MNKEENNNQNLADEIRKETALLCEQFERLPNVHLKILTSLAANMHFTQQFILHYFLMHSDSEFENFRKMYLKGFRAYFNKDGLDAKILKEVEALFENLEGGLSRREEFLSLTDSADSPVLMYARDTETIG